jgi:hypothetical protein
VPLPEYRIRAERGAALWYCLTHKSRRYGQQQCGSTDSTTKKTNEPEHPRQSFRMFHRRKTVVAKPEPTEGQQRLAEQDFWRRTLRKQGYLNVFTLFGVVAAIAAFIVLRATLHESQKATAYVRQQAQAAADQATTALNTALIAKKQLELNERGWVVPSIKVPQQSLQPRQPYRITASFSNSGKTPVKNVTGRIGIEVVNSNASPTFRFPTPGSEDLRGEGFIAPVFIGYLLPGQPPAEVPASMLQKQFSHNELAALRNGQAYVVVYSRTTYVDAFGISRWIQTCTWAVAVSGNYTAEPCTAYNGTDDN